MKTLRLFAICAILQVISWAQQSPAPFLEIMGDVQHSRTFQEQEWKQLKHVSLTATNAHDKKTATFSGVPLRDLLKDAGVPSGENLRGKAFSTTIVVSATDGYQVAFSIAELDASVGNLQVLVAMPKMESRWRTARDPCVWWCRQISGQPAGCEW